MLDVELFKTVRESGEPNFRGSRIPVPSDLKIPVWRELAADFPDQRVIDFLEFGFPINHDGVSEFSTTRIKNHRGALDFPEAVDNFIIRLLFKS